MCAAILQNFFYSYRTVITCFLHYFHHLRDFCGFKEGSDVSKLTRLKQIFEDDIETVFHNLADITEPICKSIDSEKTDMLLFDTSEIEAWVRENNPKFATRIIKQLKSYAKTLESNNNFVPYKPAYGAMPSHVAANLLLCSF